MDPFSAGMFASIGSAFKFADLAVRIAEVGSENAVFVRTICVVRSDLEEVERLWSLESVQKKLTSTPTKVPWIKTAIQNTRYALNEIGRWVERARVEQESTGSIKFETRVRWVFSDHEKLVNRKTELSTCHQQLSNVLGFLGGLEIAPSHLVSQEYEDPTHFDDILARHNRTNRPQASLSLQDSQPDAVKNGAVATGPVTSQSITLLPVSGHRSLSNVRAVNIHERDQTLRSPSVSSNLSVPGSPPPTYATAVSIEPFAYDARPDFYSIDNPPRAERSAMSGLVTDRKEDLKSQHEEVWSYRSSLDDLAIPELAGDTIVFSATNPAGPVNPFELCASPGEVAIRNSSSPQSCRDSVSELLGDLHFSAGLPSNDPGPPSGYPSRSQAVSDQAGLSRMHRTQLRNRSISETPPVVHRRPLPACALSDSLLTVHELPSPFAPHNTHQSINSQRPSSYAGNQSHRSTQASTYVPNRHYSAPPPPQGMLTDFAASFSAESTSSWGLDTHPKAPENPRAQASAMETRMQSQKRMMDLLGSIGT